MEQSPRNHHEVIEIDDKVLLRALTVEEADHLYALVDRNRQYLAEFLPWVESTQKSEDSLDFIQRIQKERSASEAFGFGIYNDGTLVGHISLMHLKDGKIPEIGYWISKDSSGQGITSKAAHAISEFGFSQLNLTEIVIKARTDNIASNRVAEKIGYTPFGRTMEGGEELNIWRKSNE